MRRPQLRLSTLLLLILVATLVLGLVAQRRAHRREVAELRAILEAQQTSWWRFPDRPPASAWDRAYLAESARQGWGADASGPVAGPE